MTAFRRYAAMMLVALALAACSAVRMPDPVGIGSDRDSLKQSPCACDEIWQNYRSWSRWG